MTCSPTTYIPNYDCTAFEHCTVDQRCATAVAIDKENMKQASNKIAGNVIVIVLFKKKDTVKFERLNLSNI